MNSKFVNKYNKLWRHTVHAVQKKQQASNSNRPFHRDIPEDVLNTYCWIHSTYTVVDAFTKKQGSEVPFPGIDNSMGHRGVPLTIRHTKYYQWVAFTLFFQVSTGICAAFAFWESLGVCVFATRILHP